MALPTVERVVVVLGAHADEVEETVDLSDVEVVATDKWRDGLSASLRAGARTLASADAILVTLGDQPFITPEVLALISENIHGPAPAARATYGGHPRHPVLIKRELFSAVGALTGERGARDLLAQAGAAVVECAHLGWSFDVDTRRDLETAQRELKDHGEDDD